MQSRIITLLTDFGLEDYFVGAIKGVLMTRSPRSVLVDITHAIPPQDIRAGAFTLNAAYSCFPPGTIHLAVVDPGVGSNRRPIFVQTAAYFFVGPDNGLFSLVLDGAPTTRVRHATNSAYFLPNPSSTFHGRDIFAPVAAALAEGVLPQELGPVIQDPIRLEFMTFERNADGSLAGSIIHIDRFGNCVTNLPSEQLAATVMQSPCLRIHESAIRELAESYSDPAVPEGQPFLICGSAGLIEISMRCSSAAKGLGIRVGDPVRLE